MLMTTPNRATLLVFGYVKEQISILSSIARIPIEIICLLQVFYDNLIHWTIEGDSFTKLLAANGPYRNILTLQGPEFMLETMKSQVYVMTKHILYQTVAIFYITFDEDTVPLNLLHFDLDLKMNANIFDEFCQKQQQLHIDTERIHLMGTRWYCGDQIPFADIKYKYEAIHLSLEIHMISASYFCMNRQCNMCWEWSMEQLSMMKQKIPITSEAVNNWLLECNPETPVTRYIHPQDKTLLVLKPRCLPGTIRSVEIEYQIVVTSDSDTVQFEGIMKSWEYSGSLYHWLYSRFCNAKQMSVAVRITICNIFDNNDTKIDNDQW
eukprot:1089714_1